MFPDVSLLQPIAPALQERLVAFRRDLHRHPELSGREARTSGKVREFLDGLGLAHRDGVAGHGIVVDLPGADESAGRIAFRGDMDALPIREETGLAFASENDGVMHACGHDGHTTILAGLAALLAEEPSLPVPVRLIFQPSEETGSGAADMIAEGVLDGVSMIFGGHLDRHYPLGTIIVTDGPVNASSDKLEIRIRGRGGHGARPHETVDAVVVASLLVTAIQTIVSREVNPAHPSVVTIGRIDAGTAPNVIADSAILLGTIRAQDEEVRQHLHGSIRRISAAIGQLHGAEIDCDVEMGAPAVINLAEGAALSREAASKVVGEDCVKELEVANMGGEDFGHFLQRRPGCYVRFGAIAEGEEHYPAHSSRFDFNEQALGIAVAYYRELLDVASRHLVADAGEDPEG